MDQGFRENKEAGRRGGCLWNGLRFEATGLIFMHIEKVLRDWAGGVPGEKRARRGDPRAQVMPPGPEVVARGGRPWERAGPLRKGPAREIRQLVNSG